MATQESDDSTGDFTRRDALQAGAGYDDSDADESPTMYTQGRYEISRGSPPAYPPDPVLPFIAPPVARRRRSDWPVLAFALIVSAVVLAACCIAGYVLYATKGSLIH